MHASKIGKGMWTREATCLLIQAYQANECMWMTTSPFYRNKQQRTEALTNIANAVSSIRPQSTVDEIKSKINGIRTQYVSEINKLIIAGHRGDAYEPTLWCFDMLSFLKPFTQPKQKTLNSWASVTGMPKPYGSTYSPVKQHQPPPHTHLQSAARKEEKKCIVIKEEIDDDIEIIEEEDVLQTDEDYNNSNHSSHLPEQMHDQVPNHISEQDFDHNPEEHREICQQTPVSIKQTTSNSDQGFDESQLERDRMRRLFSSESNAEITLVPKRDLRRKTEEEPEEKRLKIDPTSVRSEATDNRSEYEDRISIFGKFIVSQMRTITDKVLLLKLEHSIQNAIIETQLKQIELDGEKNRLKKNKNEGTDDSE